ncbi:hypothetical protein G4B88_017042 [Cannabis sativa]|uniref:DUF7036 domain-containing protein n=1 Tax=Cannabis sativa TaxID=3483 RepID=A0A7J6H0V9_CANSA|nr:hypothetical protein G4B88_017042 [Cannabis sativa]
MGKAEEEQNPVSNTGAQADGNPNSQTRFGCRCARIRRLIGLKCIFILLLSIAVFLSAIFWLPPFLQFADQADLDLDSKFKANRLKCHFRIAKAEAINFGSYNDLVTRNSTIAVAYISESPSLLLLTPTVVHGQDTSYIDATTSDVAPFSSPLLENSLSNTIGATPSMFDPSTTGVLDFDYVADIPNSGLIGQHSAAPFVSCSAPTLVSMASQTHTTILLPFSSSTPTLAQTVPSLTSILSGSTTDPTPSFTFPLSVYPDHGIVATFNLLKPVSLLEDNILQLEDDVFDELGSVASTKVVVLSLEPFKGSNETTVIFAVDPEAKYSKLSEAAESLIRGSFEIFFTRLPLFHLTPSLFGEPKSFDVLKFPGGITIIPQQNAFLLQKVQFYFNFTLNFSIHQIQANFKDLTSQLKLGLHLAPYEVRQSSLSFPATVDTYMSNLYVNLSNSKGSTISAPTVVQSSVLLTVGNTNQRMKQLAQTITGSHSKNLGLNNTVFGKVKQVRLSSIMQQYLHGGDSSASASSPSPAPFSHAHHHHHHRHHHHHHHHHSAHLAPAISPVPASQKGSPATQKGVPAPEDGAPTPAESSHEKNYEAKPPGCRFRYRSKGEERKRLHLAPAVAPAKPNVSLHHPSASPHKQVAPPKHTPNSVPVSSPLPSVIFAHTQPPSKSKPDNEHFDSRPVIAPIPPTSDAGSGSPPTVQLVLSLLLTLVLHL